MGDFPTIHEPTLTNEIPNGELMPYHMWSTDGCLKAYGDKQRKKGLRKPVKRERKYSVSYGQKRPAVFARTPTYRLW